jgi:hypothetical protein
MINLFGFKVCNAIAIVAATTFALGSLTVVAQQLIESVASIQDGDIRSMWQRRL